MHGARDVRTAQRSDGPRDKRGRQSVLKRERKRLIGVDIGSTSVKVVELSGACAPWSLESIALVPASDDGTMAQFQRAVSVVMESSGSTNRLAATSVSGSHVAVRDLRFPKLVKGEIEGAVWYEGGQVIAFDMKDAYVDYAVVDDTASCADKTTVLFAASLRSEVDAKTRVLEACGLQPRFVGVDTLVLLDALLLRQDLPETVAILNIGARCSGIGVARRDSTPFVRDLDIAGNTYTRALSEAMGISFEEAETAKITGSRRDPVAERVIREVTGQLVGELSRSMVYYQTRGHGSRIEKAFLCGGSSRLPGFASTISEALEIPVEPWSPIEDVRVDAARFDVPSVEQLAPFVSLATALAMREDAN
jgi:type IV pilus assembly protein PilM